MHLSPRARQTRAARPAHPLLSALRSALLSAGLSASLLTSASAGALVTSNQAIATQTLVVSPMGDDFMVISGGLRGQAIEAARALRQTTFGYNRDAIVSLMNQGFPAWIEDQFTKPAVSHLATVQADPVRITAPWDVVMPSIWKQYFEGQDQLRQRVAFALSQIRVISLSHNVINDAPCGAAAYLDILNNQAFGNVRTLLHDVTLNAAMGEYLSMRESAKGDPVLQTQPDENYARELMQLFSIGLWMLNDDGTQKLDGNGKPIPSYTEDTVKSFAKVLSGWSFAGQDQSNPSRWLSPDLWDADATVRAAKSCAAWSAPMEPWLEVYKSVDNKRYLSGPAHDTGPKTLLSYPYAPHTNIAEYHYGDPVGSYVRSSLEKAIDNIFFHPNVGPFFTRQLIQRLVTSNPSPAYIGRVVQKFNDNGGGVRGDMKTILRAILLDPEARLSGMGSVPSYGKLTEPVIRFVQLHRAFNAIRPNGYRGLYDFSSPTNLNQNPLRSPSVFNFYHPDFVPSGPLSQYGLYGPEFEITNASSVAGYAELQQIRHDWRLRPLQQHTGQPHAARLQLLSGADQQPQGHGRRTRLAAVRRRHERHLQAAAGAIGVQGCRQQQRRAARHGAVAHHQFARLLGAKVRNLPMRPFDIKSLKRRDFLRLTAALSAPRCWARSASWPTEPAPSTTTGHWSVSFCLVPTTHTT